MNQAEDMPATPTSAPIGPDDIDEAVFRRSEFYVSALTKGQAYQRQNRVRVAGVKAQNANDLVITAIVRGSGRNAYANRTTLTRLPSGAVIASGDCDCPVGIDCKHIVATILQWRAEAGRKASAQIGQQTGGQANLFQAPPATDKPRTAYAVQTELPGPLVTWLDDISAHLKRTERAGEAPRRRLFFVLNEHVGRMMVTAYAVDLGKDGKLRGPSKPYDPNVARNRTPPKFLSHDDLAMLDLLLRCPGAYGASDHAIALLGRDGARVLDDLIASGKAHWNDLSGPVLRRGAGLPATPDWRIDRDASQRFALDIPGAPHAKLLPVNPLHYIDTKSGAVGALQTPIGATLALKLLAAPPVPPAAATRTAELLTAAGADIVPRALPEPVRRTGAPRPLARLSKGRAPRNDYGQYGYGYGDTREPVPVLNMAFDYDGETCVPGSGEAVLYRLDSDSLIALERDLSAERQYIEMLGALGFEPVNRSPWERFSNAQDGAFWFGPDGDAHDLVNFMLDEIPVLEGKGWQVDVDADIPLRLATADDDPRLDFAAGDSDRSGIDWFDLSLGISVDGQRVDLLPAIRSILGFLPAGEELEALRDLADDEDEAPRRILVTLDDGRILPIPFARVAPIIEALLSVWSAEELSEDVRIGASDLGALCGLDDLLKDHIRVVGAEKLRALARELAAFEARKPASPPKWFNASLRPYQQTGVDWLQMLARAGFGGILADDMGLGKTVQVLAHLAIEKARRRLGKPALVIAPTSVVPNWQAEAARFASKLSVHVHHGPDRTDDPAVFDGHDLIVTSYPLLARDRDLLTSPDWSCVILDEAQTIRNSAAATSLAAFDLKAQVRFALSGTPVENHLGDVWSLMHCLNPALLGDRNAFRRRFRTPIEKHDDAGARTRLALRLKPFLLRRTKSQVAADLPAKTEIRETVILNSAQRVLYEATRLAMQKKVRDALSERGLSKSAIIVLDALLKLRQACCDPRLVRGASAKAKSGGSAKLDRLMEMLDALHAEGRSVLVFSQFTSMLDLIADEVTKRGRDFAWLTGETKNRADVVRQFQSGARDLFLISLKAGGVGLNLTRADTVILYDPWWNPAVEAQAIDRAHRIGQENPVFVHRLIAEGTIEEKMLALQEKKRDLANALWSGDGKSLSSLTEADVEALFQ